MADYFTHYSAVLTDLTPEEEDWLKAEYKRRRGVENFDDVENFDVDTTMGDFEVSFEAMSSTERRQAWFHTPNGYGNLDHVADFVQQFLKKFRPKDSWSMEWSNDCSKPRLDGFGGGAFVVTAGRVYWINTSDWVQKTTKKIHQSKRRKK